MNKNDLNVLFSHKSDNWATPQWLFDKLNKNYNFTLDPCASQDNAKCSKFYTESDNGLTKSYTNETVFVNPPYSKTYDWVFKAFHESLRGDTTIVMLLPARTDTKWFHEFCLDPILVKSVTFIKGRLKFGGHKNSAPFPSMVVEFCPPKKTPSMPVMTTMSNKL
jgi:phage N-6-adenine-methyltransferase